MSPRHFWFGVGCLFAALPAQAHGQGFGLQGNPRFNTSFSPILSMYNGQTSVFAFQNFRYFPTNVQVVQAGGAVAFVPQYQPLPMGYYLPVRGIAVGPYNRLDLAPTFGGAGIGPPMPQTTFITPRFAGGAQGRSVPFTQVLYQPTFSTVGINTSVMVPLGGRAYVVGYSNGMLGRYQFGAPVGLPWNTVNFFGPGPNVIGFGAPQINIFP